MRTFQSIIAITRLDKPIGIYLLIYPALISFIFASELLIESQELLPADIYSLLIESLIIIIVGSVLVRSAGCVINDIFDRKFDKSVERTSERPLANGTMSLYTAIVIFLLLAILSILLLLQTNYQTILLGLITAMLIILYPLSKRFILGPQFFLAITFGASVPIVFSMLGQLSLENLNYVMLLFLWNACWIIAYDTMYALGDAKDDIKIGVNSTALMWGDKTKVNINRFRIFSIICILLIGFLVNFSPMWFIGLIGILLMAHYYQNKLLEKKEFLQAFKSNSYVGLAIIILVISEVYILPKFF
jgi:4-hydroxybenzoate polyprenyltransferase